MRLKCISTNSDFTCFTSQFYILDIPLAGDSILSNVTVSVSAEILWKPVVRVVFRYSTQTQAENIFTCSTKPERIYEAVNRHYLRSAIEQKHWRNMQKRGEKHDKKRQRQRWLAGGEYGWTVGEILVNDVKQEVNRGGRWERSLAALRINSSKVI